MQLIQNKAARMALACGLRTNVTKMHENLLWMDVKNRSKYLLMVFMRNVITPNSPDQGPRFVTLYTFGPVGFGFTLQME